MAKYTKQRIDSWAASLSIDDQWKIYAKFRIYSWDRVAAWAAQEYNIEPPSRSALYRWRDYMRSKERDHRIENAILAGQQTAAIAATRNIQDPALIDAWKTFATEQALNGNVEDALRYTNMALAIAAQGTKQAELELKAAAQQTKDQQLKLAREKFEAAEGRDAAKAAITRVNQSGGLTKEGLEEIERAIKMI